jgi:hypothetical protein
VARALDLFEQVADVVELKTCSQVAQVPSHDVKRSPWAAALARSETPPEEVVHRGSERPARTPCLGRQLGGDVIVQRQRRAHIMMLFSAHHDVNLGRLAGARSWSRVRVDRPETTQASVRRLRRSASVKRSGEARSSVDLTAIKRLLDRVSFASKKSRRDPDDWIS